MQYFEKAQTSFKPPLIANENAYLGDVVSSYVIRTSSFLSLAKKNPLRSKCRESTDPEKPISGGFYRLEKGTPLVYTYTYDEIKIIVDGHFYISGMFVFIISSNVFEGRGEEEKKREKEKENQLIQTHDR